MMPVTIATAARITSSSAMKLKIRLDDAVVV
jgi:hypothetical protein